MILQSLTSEQGMELGRQRDRHQLMPDHTGKQTQVSLLMMEGQGLNLNWQDVLKWDLHWKLNFQAMLKQE